MESSHGYLGKNPGECRISFFLGARYVISYFKVGKIKSELSWADAKHDKPGEKDLRRNECSGFCLPGKRQIGFCFETMIIFYFCISMKWLVTLNLERW